MHLNFRFDNKPNLEKLYRSILDQFLASSDIKDDQNISFCSYFNYAPAFYKFSQSSLLLHNFYYNHYEHKNTYIYPPLFIDADFNKTHKDLFCDSKNGANTVFNSIYLDENNFLEQMQKIYLKNQKSHHKDISLNLNFSKKFLNNLIQASKTKFKINGADFHENFLPFLLEHNIITQQSIDNLPTLSIETLYFISVIFFRAAPTSKQIIESKGSFLDFISPKMSLDLNTDYEKNLYLNKTVLDARNFFIPFMIQHGLDIISKDSNYQHNNLLSFINFQSLDTEFDQTLSDKILSQIKEGLSSNLLQLSESEQSTSLKSIFNSTPPKFTSKTEIINELSNYLLIFKNIYQNDFFEKTYQSFTKLPLGLNKNYISLIQKIYTMDELNSKKEELSKIFPALFQSQIHISDTVTEQQIYAKYFNVDIYLLYSFIDTPKTPPMISKTLQNHLLKIYQTLNFTPQIIQNKNPSEFIEPSKKFDFAFSFTFTHDSEFTNDTFFKFVLKELAQSFANTAINDNDIREIFLKYKMLIADSSSTKNQIKKHKI